MSPLGMRVGEGMSGKQARLSFHVFLLMKTRSCATSEWGSQPLLGFPGKVDDGGGGQGMETREFWH